MVTSALPSKAVSPGEDLLVPLQDLLRGLNLLASSTDLAKANGFSAAFSGPPDSVAVLEAGATSFSKWWAAGIGASAVTLWGSVGVWWAKQPDGIQSMVLLAAAIATAALVLGLAYIVGSDVRGRAAGMVATIDARARLAEAMVHEAAGLFEPTDDPAEVQTVALAQVLRVEWTDKSGDDELGWLATALRTTARGGAEFFLSKDTRHAWVSTDAVKIPTPPAY